MGQAKQKGTLKQRQHIAAQRRWLEDIKRSHENVERIVVPASETNSNTPFEWFKVKELGRMPPMRSSAMYKIKNFKPTNHRR
jgi:hypothetical protein